MKFKPGDWIQRKITPNKEVVIKYLITEIFDEINLRYKVISQYGENNGTVEYIGTAEYIDKNFIKIEDPNDLLKELL